jgi:hypothetical protein
LEAARVARADEIRAEIRLRAAEASGPGVRRCHQRFFLAFDVLTLPEILEHVADGRLGGEPDLAGVFRVRLPRARALALRARIRHLLERIPLVFRDTAYRLGMRMHAPLASLAAQADRAQEVRLARAAHDPAAVAAVAAHLLEIFATEFRPPADGRLDPDLVAAFTAFANGRLRFECAEGRRIANGEPDGAMFLAFAELACDARANDALSAADRATWELLFRLFVPLEEVFLARYGPRTAPHTLDRYDRLRNPCAPAPPVPDERVAELFACYAARSTTELVCRHREHVYCVNRDDPGVAGGWAAEVDPRP